MLKERVITAIIGGLLLLILIYLGGIYAYLLVALLVIFSSIEISRIAGFTITQQIITVFTSLASVYFFTEKAYFYAIFILLPILAFKNQKKRSNFYPFIFTVYTMHAFSWFYRYSKTENSLFPLIYLLLLVWANDTFAYFAGLSLGRKKIAPSISPNKTVEGTIIGILAGTATLTIALIVSKGDFKILSAIIYGLILSIAAFAGDLFESHYKRFYNVKDSGKILPGHGGILDRFDSLLMVLTISSLINFWSF
ncbi:MAG: phosphatidate cytidylyltransferase [Actinobacteria bacterium]|nr:phosphatidate cytidylyltransferase [Actinomycetota bacterium]